VLWLLMELTVIPFGIAILIFSVRHDRLVMATWF